MDKEVRIAMITTGGAGSLFIYANFLYHLKRYLCDEPVRYVVIGHKSDELNELVFGNGVLADMYYNAENKAQAWSCDVVFEINFYPNVLYESASVAACAPRLHELLAEWKQFLSEDTGRHYLSTRLHRDYNTYVYGRILGKSFANIGDINGILGMGREFVWELPLKSPEMDVKSFGLRPGEYITLQSGATPGIQSKYSPKQWPNAHYAALIQLLKKLYPQKMIVQVGEASNSEPLQGVDVSLLGKTTWRQLAAVLKYAWLHIDGECGMVHLRAAMHTGPSVVIFGPTPVDFYGYQNNINIRSNVCPYPCARLTDYWQERCMVDWNYPRCMNELAPAEVLRGIFTWDYLSHISSGDLETAPRFFNQELYSDPEIIIDEDYRKRNLDYQKIYFYELQRVPLSSLQAHVMEERGFVWVPLEESPAYAMATGNEAPYVRYIQLLQENHHDEVHTVSRFRHLIHKIQAEGIDLRHRIIVAENGRIRDGQHRAAIMAAEWGLDFEVEVLQIHSFDLFPFDLLKRGSRILLYGAGGVGMEYFHQVEVTGYCQVAAMVDQFPFVWNDVPERRAKAPCISPKEISEFLPEIDAIVVSSANGAFVDEIREQLALLGVPPELVIARKR